MNVTKMKFELVCKIHECHLEHDGGSTGLYGTRPLDLTPGGHLELSNWYCPEQDSDENGNPVYECDFAVLMNNE